MFRSILVTLDDSSQAAAALVVAQTVAVATGGSLTLLRVVPRLAMVLASEAASDLNATAHELSGGGLRVDAIVRHGEPATEILREARRRGVELIVTTTHLHGQQSGAVLADVPRQLLAESTAPVLMVRRGGVPTVQLRTLLVPVDGSPGDSLALAASVAPARGAAAVIEFLEVVDRAPADETRARVHLESLTHRVADTGLVAHGQVATGDLPAAIVRYAEEAAVDLIVMTTPAGLGRVADAIVRADGCPVLLVRGEPPAAEVTSKQ